MTRIGSRSIAQAAVDLARSGRSMYGYEDAEWKCLGSSCRVVLLHKETNIVYKVDKNSDYYSENDNAIELKVAKELYRESNNGRIGTKVRIPRVTGWNVKYPDSDKSLVIAMEFVSGTLGSDAGRKAAKGRKELVELCRLADMHNFNYVVLPRGEVVPIDLGSRRRAVNSREYVDTRCLVGNDNW